MTDTELRKCNICANKRSLEYFTLKSNGDMRKSCVFCVKYMQDYHKKHYIEKSKKLIEIQVSDIPENHKFCPKCSNIKPLTEFKQKIIQGGYFKKCILCLDKERDYKYNYNNKK